MTESASGRMSGDAGGTGTPCGFCDHDLDEHEDTEDDGGRVLLACQVKGCRCEVWEER